VLRQMPAMNRVCDKVPVGPACRTSLSVIWRGRRGMANEGRRKRPDKNLFPYHIVRCKTHVLTAGTPFWDGRRLLTPAKGS